LDIASSRRCCSPISRRVGAAAPRYPVESALVLPDIASSRRWCSPISGRVGAGAPEHRAESALVLHKADDARPANRAGVVQWRRLPASGLSSLSVLDRADVELELDAVGDEHAAGLER